MTPHFSPSDWAIVPAPRGIAPTASSLTRHLLRNPSKLDYHFPTSPTTNAITPSPGHLETHDLEYIQGDTPSPTVSHLKETALPTNTTDTQRTKSLPPTQINHPP